MPKVSLPAGMALGIHDSYQWNGLQWMPMPDARLMSQVTPIGLTVTAGNAFLTTASPAPSFTVSVPGTTTTVLWKLRDMYDNLVNAGTTTAHAGSATVTFPLPATGFFRVSMKPAEAYGWVEFGLLVTAASIAANPFCGMNTHLDSGGPWSDHASIIGALAVIGVGAIRQTYVNPGSNNAGALSDFQSGGPIRAISDLCNASGMKINYQTWPNLATTSQAAFISDLNANIAALGIGRFCGISFGNEFDGTITGTQYAAFMQAIYAALHTAHPTVPLVAGQTGTGTRPGGTWWGDFKTANGLHYCDVINWHEYGGRTYTYATDRTTTDEPYLAGATNPTTGQLIKMEIGETGASGVAVFNPRQYTDEYYLDNWLVASGGGANYPMSGVYLYDAVMDGGQNGELLPGQTGTAPGSVEANFGMIAPPGYINGVSIYTPTARCAPIATFNRFVGNTACSKALISGATITGATGLGLQASFDRGVTWGGLAGDEIGGSFGGVGGKAVVSVGRICSAIAYDVGNPTWSLNSQWRIAKPVSATYTAYDVWGQVITDERFSQDSTYLYFSIGEGSQRIYMVQN